MSLKPAAWMCALMTLYSCSGRKGHAAAPASEEQAAQQGAPPGSQAGTDPAATGSHAAAVKTWAVTYGGPGWDEAFCVRESSDGGYFVAGETKSFGGGEEDLWVLKLDAGGTILWQETFGDADNEEAYSVEETGDGGCIVAGATESYGPGNYDVWIIRLDAAGHVLWQKVYGGADDDFAYSVRRTDDGGFVLAGVTESYGMGKYAFLVIRLDPGGSILWSKTYGTAASDYAYSVQQTADGGFAVAGSTRTKESGDDVWVLKLDDGGAVLWQKRFGGKDDDIAYGVDRTPDGGCIVAGKTESYGTESDVWVLRLDGEGDVVWQNTYGGPGYDWANAVHRTADGGAVVAGLTDSWGAGDWDFWMFRLDEKGSILWQKTYGGQSDDWSQSVERTSDGGTIVAGGTKSLGVGMRDFWVIKTDAKGEVAGPCPPGMISDSSCGPVASSAVPVATAAAPAAPATGFGETGAAAVHSQAVVMDQCGQAAASMQQAAGRAPKER